eukprot:SAG31_NODE_107_length_24865_cov_17.973593_15_plen_100_part_00
MVHVGLAPFSMSMHQTFGYSTPGATSGLTIVIETCALYYAAWPPAFGTLEATLIESKLDLMHRLRADLDKGHRAYLNLQLPDGLYPTLGDGVCSHCASG